ncbi:hypothetical protein FCV25MIE_17756 [Fagus crenata]
MAGKGVVEAGGSKSYKDVVMDRKHEREERLEISQPAIKQLKSGELPEATVEVPSAGSGNGSGSKIQTKKGVTIPPQISASIKPRQPLRFFPDVSPMDSRNLGKGLTIQLNDNGQRRVAWTSQIKERIKEKWVPRVRTNTEAISSEIGPIELVNCGCEPFKVGLEREVGIPTACVGLEDGPLMKTHWALVPLQHLKWGLPVGKIISLGLTVT